MSRLWRFAVLWLVPIASVGALALGLFRTVGVGQAVGAAGDIDVNLDITLVNLALIFIGALLLAAAIGLRSRITAGANPKS